VNFSLGENKRCPAARTEILDLVNGGVKRARKKQKANVPPNFQKFGAERHLRKFKYICGL
jgi:hypothetical protein